MNKTLIESVKTLRRFVSPAQLETMADLARGEEGDWWKAQMNEMASRIATMPKTYEQDGPGDKTIAYLHYFSGGADWYITEKDMDDEQLQAFGYADLGYGGELGYISIEELVRNGIELDMMFEPTPLREVI